MSNSELPFNRPYALPPSHRELETSQSEPESPRYLTISQRIGAHVAVFGFGVVAGGEISGADDQVLLGALAVGAIGSTIMLIATSAKNVVRQ